ncbi:hypothetical protein [uncultured Methanobrevibacter sp.]|nr:hypothetical protein [uncultured Methanobrevibacter sp.]
MWVEFVAPIILASRLRIPIEEADKIAKEVYNWDNAEFTDGGDCDD